MSEDVHDKSRPDINEAVRYLKEKLGVMKLDGTVNKNRQMCTHLLNHFEKEFPKSDPVVCVKRLINIALADEWHKTKATNFYYLWNNMATLVLKGKHEREVSRTPPPPQNHKKEFTVKVDADRSKL
jgi:hypothetical protein